MLHFMRKHAKYFYVFFFLIIISFVFFYVGPIEDNGQMPLAEVKKERIAVEEFWRAYYNMRDFYRDIYKEKFDAEMEKELNLKEKALRELVAAKVLYVAALDAGFVITDQELRDAIMNDPIFQRDGQFRQDIYQNILRNNRMSPKYFEQKKKEELLSAKMRELIEASVVVSDEEIPDIQGSEDLIKSLKEGILNQKRSMAVDAYVEALKKKYKVVMRAELIA